ncbi:MAG: DUF721 domain-containing protein [Rhodospirillales bacterium]
MAETTPAPAKEPVPAKAPPSWKRTDGGPKALAHALGRATKRAFGIRGFADGAVVRAWPEIVGPALAQESTPERIDFPPGKRAGGVLHLRVEPGGMAVELQHLAPLVIERVNGFFGFRCVERLMLVQGPVAAIKPASARRAEAAPRPAPSEAETKAVEQLAAGIADESLRESVRGLGLAMAGRGSPPNPEDDRD